MAWIHAALASVFLLASGTSLLAQQDNAPVPPVYVPEEQQDDVPSGPPAVCEGQNCLPPAENPVEACEGQDCTPEPLEESE